MTKRILIDGAFPDQYRVALLNQQNKLEALEYESSNINQIKGNIYLAKIVRIEPGLQAAFIEYGSGKNGFLPFSEIHPGYYNIPVSDAGKNESQLLTLQEISSPSDNIDDTKYAPSEEIKINLDEEIDISKIEKFIDEETSPEIDIESSDSDFDRISEKSDDELPLYKQYKIQEVMKRGQIILVQAQKEERGNKGASFTSYISLAGKYAVLMPNNPGHHGISRKISNSGERRRLRDIISDLVNENDSEFASVIIRTAGVGKSASEIKRDYEYMVNLWNDIREKTLKSAAPALIHIEEGIIQKTIRDLFDSSVTEMLIDGQEAFDSAVNFIKRLLPKEVGKIKKHNKHVPLFSEQGIEEQIADLYQQSFHLPSGGYIVINPTEALTSIDVNSGKSTSEKNIEETALKTNVEAAKEIARQLKLRDISGLIVIDFIDMYEHRNRKIVERSLREYVSKDKAKIQLSNISNFGLLELSRQRLRPSFLESHTKMCSHCNGKGIVRDDEANSMVILRTIENEIFSQTADIINVYCNSSTSIYLLNYKRLEIVHIEEKYGVKINFMIDHFASSDSFSIEKLSLPTFGENTRRDNKIDSPAIDFRQEGSKNNNHKQDDRKPKKQKPKQHNKKQADKPETLETSREEQLDPVNNSLETLEINTVQQELKIDSNENINEQIENKPKKRPTRRRQSKPKTQTTTEEVQS
jgi:ribonuclease E